MGLHVSKPLHACSTEDVVAALTALGAPYAVYGLAITTQGITGDALLKVQSSNWKALLEQTKVSNPLHRMVLQEKLKRWVSLSSCQEQSSSSNNNNGTDHDSYLSSTPDELVALLQELGPEYLAYSQAAHQNAVDLQLLSKVTTKRWTAVFEGLGIADIFHQNIVFNTVCDRVEDLRALHKEEQKLIQQEVDAAGDTAMVDVVSSSSCDQPDVAKSQRNGLHGLRTSRSSRGKTSSNSMKESVADDDGSSIPKDYSNIDMKLVASS